MTMKCQVNIYKEQTDEIQNFYFAFALSNNHEMFQIFKYTSFQYLLTEQMKTAVLQK